MWNSLEGRSLIALGLQAGISMPTRGFPFIIQAKKKRDLELPTPINSTNITPFPVLHMTNIKVVHPQEYFSLL